MFEVENVFRWALDSRRRHRIPVDPPWMMCSFCCWPFSSSLLVMFCSVALCNGTVVQKAGDHQFKVIDRLEEPYINIYNINLIIYIL